MSFQAPQFTTAGKRLQARALAGEVEITFTRMALGSGDLSSQAIADLKSLIEPVKFIDINNKKIINSDQVQLTAVFQNVGMIEGFFWREVGLFAADPDNPADREKDILYCYQNAGDLAEYIPSASSQLVDKILSMSVVVADASTVHIAFFSESYALKEDLDEQIALQAQSLENHKKDVNAHNELFSQYVKKSGDTMSGALVMADSAQIFKNKDDHFLGLYGGSNFNNGAFFEICGKDHEEQSGNFNIYANNGTQSARLNGTPTGSLTWQGHEVVRSVNGVDADASGNVTINASSVEESWTNGYNGYRVYSDGFCEQWGFVSETRTAVLVTVNLHKTYKDTYYNINTELRTQDNTTVSNSTDIFSNVQSIATTSFKVNIHEVHDNNVRLGFYWHTWGYIR